VKENHVCLFDVRSGLFHILADVILKESLVLSAHLGTHTSHDLRSLVCVHLPSTLLLSHNVFLI
jgi:hypothetical protein